MSMETNDYVFVVVSSQLGSDRCALISVEASDLGRAEATVQGRLPERMTTVSFVRILGRQTASWNFFLAFVNEPGGELFNGLRFRPYDFLGVGHVLGVDVDEFYVNQNPLRHRYSIIAALKIESNECAACFDWYSTTVYEICDDVKSFLPSDVEICGVYAGTTPLVRPNCAGCAVVRKFGFVEFLDILPESMMKIMDTVLMQHHGNAFCELERLVLRSAKELE